jgi:hypothetical protein
MMPSVINEPSWSELKKQMNMFYHRILSVITKGG